MTDPHPVRRYASAGGVVIGSAASAVGDMILILVRPKRAGPDGSLEVRLPKGHIEPGESREEAALREVAEEAGILEDVSGLVVLADLGHQTVEFDWKGRHYVRDESCFLMSLADEAGLGKPEKQFSRHWLSWELAFERVTFEAEREWIRRAREAWVERKGAG